jgi:3-oxoacyl-[acyl-carrier protein] reductase
MRVALVTGASGALGAAVARVLDRIGCRTALHYRSRSAEAEKLQGELINQSITVQADVSDWPAVAAMERAVRGCLGPVDIVVTCAGVRLDAVMAGQAPDEWRRVVETNLLGTFHAVRAVLPRMLRRRWGRVVTVVSPSGLRGIPGQTAYAASKAGVVGLTRTLAMECARRNVTVNALSPGYMDTALTETLPRDTRSALLRLVPLQRAAEPAEVAEAVRFIAETPYLTGQVISVDGGASI